MEPDNTLGAPTEGLGQTPTFVPQVAQEASIGGAGDPGRSRMAVLGGFGPGVQQAQFMPSDTGSPTMQFLAKTLARTGEAYGKDKQTRDFLDGMHRAASGEAVEDIAEEQPWYSKIFGEADVVAGARAYGQERRTQQLFSEFEARMPELRKLSEADFAQVAAKSIKDSMTGHTPTDAAIMAAVQRGMPGVYKLRTKESYQYHQELAASEQSQAILAVAGRLQTAKQQHLDQKLTDADWEARKAEAGSLAVPAMGQDLLSAQTTLLTTAGLLAEQGNFHALNAFEEVGVISQLLTPDQQSRYIRNRETNEAQLRVRKGGEYIDLLARLKVVAENPSSDPGWDANATLRFAADINARWMDEQGTKTPLLSPELVASYGERTSQAIEAVARGNLRASQTATEKAAKDADAASAAKLRQASALDALAKGFGKLIPGEADGGMSAGDRDRLMLTTVLPGMSSPHSQAAGSAFAMIAANADRGYVNDQVQAFLKGDANAAVYEGKATPGFGRSFEQWRRLRMLSPNAAVQYYGDELNQRFEKFRLLHPESLTDAPAANSTAAAAFQSAFGVGSSPRAKKFSDAETKTGIASAAKELTHLMPEVFGGDVDVKSSQVRQLENILRPYAELHGETLPPDEAWKLAVTSAKRDGMQVAGGYVWQDRTVGVLYDKIQGMLRSNPDKTKHVELPGNIEFSQYMQEAIGEAAKLSGAGDTIQTYGTQRGVAIVGWDRNGKPVNAEVTFDQMAEGVRKRTIAQRSKVAQPTAVAQPTPKPAPARNPNLVPAPTGVIMRNGVAVGQPLN